MKRRRRIEITRYSRRVTVIEGPAVADKAAEQDLILGMVEVTPLPPPESQNRLMPEEGAAQRPPRHWTLFRLRDLFRLSKRM